MHFAPLTQCSISCTAQRFFFWHALNNRDNKVLGSSDGTQCPQAAGLDPSSVICTQQCLLLLPLFCCLALHMQIGFPKAELDSCAQLAGLCLPLYDIILSLGLLHKAGKTQVPPNDHHLSPQEMRNPDSYIKSHVDFKALFSSSRIWLNSPLVGSWQHAAHH